MSNERRTYVFEKARFATTKAFCFSHVALFAMFVPPLAIVVLNHYPEYNRDARAFLVGAVAGVLVNIVLYVRRLRGLKVTLDENGMTRETSRRRAFLPWTEISHFRIVGKRSPLPAVRVFTGPKKVGMFLPSIINSEPIVAALEEIGIPCQGERPLTGERIAYRSRLWGYVSLGLLLVGYCGVLADALFRNAMPHFPSEASIALTGLPLLLALYVAGLAIVTGMASLNTFRVGWLSEENPRNGIVAGLAGILGAVIVWLYVITSFDRLGN